MWSCSIGCSSRFVISCTLLILCSRQTLSTTIDTNSTNVFVRRCEMDCRVQKDLNSCAKYKVVKWLNDLVREKEFSYGPIRIVRINSMVHQTTVLPKLPQSRVFRNDVMDTLNFARDTAEDLLTKRALVYTVDNSAGTWSFGTGLMIVDEDELTDMQKTKDSDGNWRFLKKKSLILPILILLNLIKLKLLVLPILMGVHFIKKLLVLGSLALPSLLAHLKVCKVSHHQQTYPYHTWATAAESPVDYPTGYGQEESSWIHRNDYPGHFVYPGYQGYRNPYG